ncbi:Kelch repeat-containing protein [Tuwongella immobilis]|uniref:Uncharacterized protein n=1 Tax=Tuwongella immobilis TaxID=692036 RepID=A0A6C2YUD9_9BACT|nr:hypothetical protein [Tuwongella immobilis]VIP04763.1 kelch repeat-containing protein : Kelch repeat protein OS=Pirellula staleyi (strain ATCC 27377 / DSM 6068 / ICPB 4128) GN=Psta_4524 PE=4 SV=1: Kelch_1: Kelch_1 [Tuwongella immobilis]VTS06885.1 kelch repeat-containing protein : Kelch repeat protein OS=Pirellula staleyi (strain ATCC 27377 / DSM 6068 / ICPB 4128) GN=Psta_4524 PE=4 SV=1: Kelch_1: Kelch_1 [Tuwongella immobilis]
MKILTASLGLLLMLGVTASAETPALNYPPTPESVSSLGAIASDGYVYVYGGHRGKAHSYSVDTASGNFARLNLVEGKQWEKLPGGPGVQGMNLAAHQGLIYRVGGMQPRNAKGQPSDNHSLADAARYNPQTNAWEALPALPEARSSHDLVVIGNSLVVIGGWKLAGKSEPEWATTGLMMDLSAKKLEWKSFEQPFKRRALTAASLNGKLYVLGGLDMEGEASRQVAIYDPATKQWSEGPAYPGSGMDGFSAAACVLRDRLYLSVASGPVLRLSADGKSWEKIGELANKRFVHRLVPIAPDRLMAVGGASRGANVATVDVVQLPAEPTTPVNTTPAASAGK